MQSTAQRSAAKLCLRNSCGMLPASLPGQCSSTRCCKLAYLSQTHSDCNSIILFISLQTPRSLLTWPLLTDVCWHSCEQRWRHSTVSQILPQVGRIALP
jgi:hypothetical protein